MEVTMAVTTFKATSRRGTSPLEVVNEVRGFKVTMDEPESLGGTDKGMNPVEGLLISLGSCLVIVVSAFANAHKINVQDVWVETEGDLDPDGFLLGKEGVRPGYQAVRLTLHIKSDSPEDKLQEFVKFVYSRCPVGDTLRLGTSVSANQFVIER
jgi:uncharacterized OsmC-like protein